MAQSVVHVETRKGLSEVTFEKVLEEQVSLEAV
jgi:hypothetical protein